MLQKLIDRVSERGSEHLEGSSIIGAVRMCTFLVPFPGDSEAGRELTMMYNNFELEYVVCNVCEI